MMKNFFSRARIAYSKAKKEIYVLKKHLETMKKKHESTQKKLGKVDPILKVRACAPTTIIPL